ncbi:hypothetical protein LWI28_028666 [Acer negundo]|uniref:Uncharacterized protein n=1 Tax=Acer negundo TaxID=4023 RepID=A0AAD5JNL0_ACENE|nr:hypothetical protein LWI28_028666 [Acer negundo]KAK4856173.1 hypothetical protein QYF36_014833 [Acer negundo]
MDQARLPKRNFLQSRRISNLRWPRVNERRSKDVVPSGGQPNPNFKRKILMERGINMKEIADTFVMEEHGRLEWHTFVTMRNQCNEQMAYLLNLAKAENIQAFVSKHPFGQ